MKRNVMTGEKRICSLILAAGKGTRMKSAMAKVLHQVFFRPMLHHVLDAVAAVPNMAKILVVVGFQRQQVADAVADFGVSLVDQDEQRGTGHAVLCAAEALRRIGTTVLIICGDVPLIRPETIQGLVRDHQSRKPALTVLTTRMADPSNYGRIVSGHDGHCLSIVEERDASAEEKKICTVNAGIYCAEITPLLEALSKIGCDNDQGELYLTDAVKILNQQGQQVHVYEAGSPGEVLGVNSRLELAEAHKTMQLQRNQALMAAGVTLLDPGSITIAPGVLIGRDTCIEANVHISGKTRIGCGCLIGTSSVLQDCQVEDRCLIPPLSLLHNCRVPA